ncbi:MAG: hypothetical protein GF350_10670 [Chitinivibrionales bacterium]|nr:hypothetical protein [Chitinivibrionales bacterium]
MSCAACAVNFVLSGEQSQSRVNRMPSFRLSFPVDIQEKDRTIGICYSAGMEGCWEAEQDGRVIMHCYFSDIVPCEAAKCHIGSVVEPDCIAVEHVDNRDWNARWRDSIRPVNIAPSIWVSPEWRAPELLPGEHWIKIEPAMAFGTGHHETTQLVASVLRQRKEMVRNSMLCDIGAGTGILCFIADCLGAKKCLGIEIDNAIRENMAENRRLNSTGPCINFIVGSIDSINNKAAFDCIVMNMLRSQSGPLLETVHSLCTGTALFVWSGLLVVEKKAAVSEAGKAGFTLNAEHELDEWWCGEFSVSN